jgi:glycosyltransferase involved in cell wall biosynthesis
MKHRHSPISNTIAIVAPGDPSSPHAADVEYAKVLAGMLGNNFQTQILYFKGHNYFRPRAFFYLRLPKWILAYTRNLLTQKGVIIIVNNLGIAFWTACVRSVFRRRYQVIPYVPNVSGIARRSNELAVRTSVLFNRFLWEKSLTRCDAILADPNGVPDELIPRMHGPILHIPVFLVDTERLSYNSAGRSRIRSLTGICEDRPVVGVIGPFHEHNKPSITYVLENLDRFTRNAFFLLIGDVSPDDVIRHERIRFVGRVERLDEYISTCDCILIPRYVHYGSPMGKMINAMAAGVPVVTNDLEGMEVKPGKDVMLGTLDELPDLANFLLTNSELAKQIGDSGRQHIIEHFSTESVREPLFRFLCQFLKGP